MPSWRDRARKIAFNMKKTTTNNTGEGDLDGALPNLMHIIEVQRDYSVSAGSRRKGGWSESRSKGGVENASRHDNQSKGSSFSGSANDPCFQVFILHPLPKMDSSREQRHGSRQ